MNETDYVQEDGLSLLDIYNIFKKNLLAFLLIFGIIFLAGGAFTFATVEPTYTATTKMIVQVIPDASNSSEYNNYLYATKLANTYASFVQSEAVLNLVATELNDGSTSSSLKKGISVKTAGDSLILNFNFTSKIEVYSIQVVNILAQKSIEVADTIPVLEDKLYILDLASTSEADSNKLLYTALSFLGGLVVASLYIFIKELFSKKFKDEDDVERQLKLTVLASIPFYEIKNGNGGKE